MCIQSIQQSENAPYNIVVVDNASDIAPTLTGRVHLIQLTDNKGFAGANNIGIRYALSQNDCSHILLLNNDTLIEPNTLSSLLEKSILEPKFIYGSRLLSYYNKEKYDHIGGFWNTNSCKFDLLLHNLDKSQKLQPEQTIDYVCGASIFANKTIFEDVGPMDERYFLYFEEADWCFKAKKKGYRCKICYEAIVYHKGAASQKNPSVSLSYYLWRNRFLFIKNNFSLIQRVKFYLKPIAYQVLKLLIQCCIKTLNKKSKRRLARLKILRAARSGVIDAIKSNYGQAHF